MSERYVTKSCDKLGDSQNMSPIISPDWSQNSVNHQIVHQICHKICHQTPWGSYMVLTNQSFEIYPKLLIVDIGH